MSLEFKECRGPSSGEAGLSVHRSDELFTVESLSSDYSTGHSEVVCYQCGDAGDVKNCKKNKVAPEHFKTYDKCTHSVRCGHNRDARK